MAGYVQGRDLRVGAASLAIAHAAAQRWRRSDPTARVCWYLHPDWPEPVTALVRLRPGLVGEHQRTVHLVTLYPGVRQGGVLRTWCAQLLDLHTVEWPNVGQGMPCLRAPREASPQEVADTAVPASQVPADQNAPASPSPQRFRRFRHPRGRPGPRWRCWPGCWPDCTGSDQHGR